MKMFRNLLLLTVGTLVLMLGIGFYTADPDAIEKPPADTVIRLFDRIAFSAQEGSAMPVLRRWTQPVKAVLIGARPSRKTGRSAGPTVSPRCLTCGTACAGWRWRWPVRLIWRR